MRRVPGLVPAALTALGMLSAPLAATGGACVADASSRLGRAHHELMIVAAEAAGSAELRCAAKGRALADYLQVGPLDGACAAWSRMRVTLDETDADSRAFGAWMAWRCGAPREAHRLAREALALDPHATAAWTLLGKILTARFREDGARAAYRRALSEDPWETGALLGLASVTSDRDERIALLRRFVTSAGARGEARERVRSALENLEFVQALGDREIFRLERAELPGTVELEPIIKGPGRIAGWTVPLRFGEGRPLDALLDSGASGLHLEPRAAEAGKIEELSEGTLVGGGGSGEHEVRRGLLPMLDLGPLAFADALAVRAAGDLHQRGRYRAILGVDLFGGTRLAFDPEKRRVEVLETESLDAPDDPLVLDPWTHQARRVAILRVSGMLLVPARVSVRDQAVDVLLLLDTGASRSLLAFANARLLPNTKLGGRGSARAYGGAVPLMGEVPRAELSLGGVDHGLSGIPVFSLEARSHLVGVPVGGFLGVDWLSRQGFTIDLREGWVEIEDRRRRR